MTQTERNYLILAAVQFDETGDWALREACRFARRAPTAELHLVHAVTPSLATEHNGESTAIAAQLARAPEKLRAYVDRACAGTTLKIIAHVRSGSPVDVITQTAADLDADLVVLGTHHRTGLERLISGSVAERVLREAPCPVLVAMPKSSATRASSQPFELPCEECLAARNAARDPEAWCARHPRSRLRPLSRLNMSSYGEFRPIATNHTAEGRASKPPHRDHLLERPVWPWSRQAPRTKVVRSPI
jgi:nucleotide-binding universal stress UspA family protein